MWILEGIAIRLFFNYPCCLWFGFDAKEYLETSAEVEWQVSWPVWAPELLRFRSFFIFINIICKLFNI